MNAARILSQAEWQLADARAGGGKQRIGDGHTRIAIDPTARMTPLPANPASARCVPNPNAALQISLLPLGWPHGPGDPPGYAAGSA